MFSPRWRKVTRDLWSNKTRTILVVLAIAVGVFAFGSTFITQEVLLVELDTAYESARASTITMFLPSFDDNLVKWAERQPEIAYAQGKAVYMIKLVGAQGTYNTELHAYGDYEKMELNLVRRESGSWPPGRSELLLERSSAALAGLNYGDSVTLEMADGSRRELRVSGTVYDVNAVPANLFPRLTTYVNTRTLGLLGLPAGYNRLEILTADQYRTVEELEAVANKLKAELENDGMKVNSIKVRKPGEHWARQTTQSFSLILSFVGFFSLLMSGFLVVNTMSALLAEQKRQIGIMKAVGGTGRQITGIYLTLVAAYGLLALLVAVPVGMGLGYLFTLSVVRFLNTDLLNFHLPLSVLFLQTGTALVVPVLASLVPVIGGVKITIRKAISSYGINGKQKQGRLERLVLHAGGLPGPVLLSLRNTFRRRARLLLTLGTLTVAGTLFITVVNVRGSLMTELDNVLKDAFNYEVVLGLDGKYDASGLERRAGGIAGVVKAEAQTSLAVQRTKADGTVSATFPIVGLRPDSDFMQPAMAAGRWLKAGDRNAVVITSKLAKDLSNVVVGDTLTTKLNQRTYNWKVVGITALVFDPQAFANFDYVSGVAGEAGQAGSVQVSLAAKDGLSQSQMANVLEKQLKASGVKVVFTMTRETIFSTNASQFDFLVAFLLAMAAMTALIGALGLAGMMSLNVMERTREIGVMRSIGASNAMVGAIVIAEGVLIGLLSWALAIPLSLPINLMFNALLGQLFLLKPLVYVFSPAGVMGWLAIVVLVSVVASALPAYRAVKMSIRETLAYE